VCGLQAIARLVLSCGVCVCVGGGGEHGLLISGVRFPGVLCVCGGGGCEWPFDIAGLVRLGIVPEFLFKFHTYVSVIFVYTLYKHVLYFNTTLPIS